MSKSNVNEILKPEVSLSFQSRSPNTYNGTAIDCFGADEVLVLAIYGTFTATAVADVKVQESSDGTTGFTDVPGAVFAQVTDSTDETMKRGRLWMRPRKRWLRGVAVTATATTDLGLIFVLAEHRNTPVTQPVAFEFNVA